VTNGKGATFARAKASALGEALELWASEHPDPARLEWRRARGEAFWTASFLGADPAGESADVAQPWAGAGRLDRAGRVYVPASHVWCPAPGEPSVGLRTTGWTSNGLGAHPSRDQARWHGLLEVLEREALCRTLPEGWLPEHLSARGVAFAHPLAARLRAQGVAVHAVDSTPARWPVPVAAVLVADPDTRAPRLAAGYACRRTPGEALEAAFFEACQSRLTEIHGAREDVEQARADIPEWVLQAPAPRRRPSSMPAWRGSMRGLLRRLGVAAAAVDLTPPGVPLHVARVFVPGYRHSELL
jgi:ribosomal protein S12 methylthiotransferase accessory factor